MIIPILKKQWTIFRYSENKDKRVNKCNFLVKTQEEKTGYVYKKQNEIIDK